MTEFNVVLFILLLLQISIMEELDPETNSVPREHIERTFDQFVSNTLLFSGINTKQTLDSFLKLHCDIISPEPVELFCEDRWNKNGDMIKVPHNAFVSPFLPSLKRLLQQNDILQGIDQPREHEGI